MADYNCSKCNKRGVKLWRQVVAIATQVDLLCADCGGENQKIDSSTIAPDGQMPTRHGDTTDQLGRLLPAVPDGEGSFWGYTSVPEQLVAWWRSLPLR